MRIYIKEKDSNKIKIPVPMGIIEFGVFNADFIISMLRHKMDEKTVKYLHSIDFHMLAKNFRILSKYKGLAIVDIKTGDGEEISIVV